MGTVYTGRLEDNQQECSKDDYIIISKSLHKRGLTSKAI